MAAQAQGKSRQVAFQNGDHTNRVVDITATNTTRSLLFDAITKRQVTRSQYGRQGRCYILPCRSLHVIY